MPRRLADMEKKTIKTVGARATRNSGATHADGDAVRKIIKKNMYGYRGVLYEIKSTEKTQFILKRDILDKAEAQAFPLRLLASVVVDFGDKRYVVLDERDFTSIMDKLTE